MPGGFKMIFKNFDSLTVLESELFLNYDIKHLFTTIKDETKSENI